MDEFSIHDLWPVCPTRYGNDGHGRLMELRAGWRSGAKPAFAELTKGKTYDMTAGNSPGYIGSVSVGVRSVDRHVPQSLNPSVL